MKIRVVKYLFLMLALMLAILLSGCLPSTEPTLEDSQPTSGESQSASEDFQLATARVSSQLAEQPGRASVTGHNNLQFFVDSEPSTDGLREIDTVLAAQATCAVFVAEKAAQELDFPLTGATSTTTFDEDKQQVHVFLDLPGANDEQILDLATNFRQRCPVYTTLAEAKSVEFTPGEQFVMGAEDTPMVTATLFRFGGTNVTARGNTFVMDSVPPLDGPNEELNPLDMMLGGLAACGSFVAESEAPLANATVVVEGDLDPRGVRNLNGPNPRFQNMRISVQFDEYDEEQAIKVEEGIREQCYLYSTLKGTMNIEISTGPVSS